MTEEQFLIEFFKKDDTVTVNARALQQLIVKKKEFEQLYQLSIKENKELAQKLQYYISKIDNFKMKIPIKIDINI